MQDIASIVRPNWEIDKREFVLFIDGPWSTNRFWVCVIPTLQQEAAFGRVYAAYGSIFIVLALLWGWLVDGWQPNRYDIAGAAVAMVGVAIIMWGRRL
jgi:drug/metabolite transporter superfamily protein YnfA